MKKTEKIKDKKKMKTAYQYHEEFSKILEAINDAEFISSFNCTVGIRAFGFARQGYLWALHDEFTKRNIDYANIGNDASISFRYIVYLKDKKVYRLTDLNFEEVERHFNNYLLQNHPEKMEFKPKIVEYDNDVIKYEIDDHSEIFTMESNNLVKKTSGNNA